MGEIRGEAGAGRGEKKRMNGLTDYCSEIKAVRVS